jgi:hypothetical protein
MFLGPRITLGAFVPDDYGAMYCWANDIAAARLDGAFRPVNLRDVIASCETGGDASRVMLAIRQLIPSVAPTRRRGPAGHRVASARSEVSHRPRGTVPASPLIFVTVAND